MIESVLFLMLVFIFTAFLFVLLGAEFLAILIIIIYVGAISILFLFIVMMLNLRVVELHSTFYNYFPISALLFVFILLFLFYFFFFDFGILVIYFNSIGENFDLWSTFVESNSNLLLIGVVLYEYNSSLVLIAAVLLLVAMIGTIALTVDTDIKKISRKKQDLFLESNLVLKPICLYKDININNI